jgi:hypothetical protein
MVERSKLNVVRYWRDQALLDIEEITRFPDLSYNDILDFSSHSEIAARIHEYLTGSQYPWNI